MAQNQSEDEKLKQVQEEQMKAIQEKMEQEKMVQEEQLRARKEMLLQQQEQMRVLEEQYATHAREMERQTRDIAVPAPMILGESGIRSIDPIIVSSWGQANQSQLTLRKTFRETTTSTSKGEFDVDGEIRQFRCTINGTVRTGEIVVGVSYPDGKTFKEMVINSSADINFSQSVSIKEGEEEKYTGTWKYVIKADKAEGNYMLQIMTN